MMFLVCLLINEKAAFLNLKYTCYRKRYYSTPVSFLWGYLNKKDIFNKDVYIIQTPVGTGIKIKVSFIRGQNFAIIFCK